MVEAFRVKKIFPSNSCLPTFHYL